MKNKWVKLVLGLCVVFSALQLFPVDRSNPPVEGDLAAPAAVQSILRRSCYDCHSNETVWPWYSHVAPVSILVAGDVKEGREELNFSNWKNYSAERQNRYRESIVSEVSEGEMPLWFYTPLHPKAKLSKEDIRILTEWANSR